MEKLVMKASVREDKGKNACKHLRRSGLVPGIVYKGGAEALSIQVDGKELWHTLHTEAGENAIITLNISDGQEKTVIAHEVQTDPITDRVIHVDFHEISLTEVIAVKIPVVLKGEAPGVTEGGVLNQVMWEIEIECKAMDLPEHIDVHVDSLNIGDGIHIKDLVLPETVQILEDPDQLVVGVHAPQVEEEEPIAEAEGEEPELIKRSKKEEEEGEEETSDKSGKEE